MAHGPSQSWGWGLPVVYPGVTLLVSTTTTGFRFGVSSSHCESVKNLLYPHIESDDRFFKKQYIKSHQVGGLIENSLGRAPFSSPSPSQASMCLGEGRLSPSCLVMSLSPCCCPGQSYEPGEQKRRDYTWSIDPSKYRFGVKGGQIPYNGVSSGESSRTDSSPCWVHSPDRSHQDPSAHLPRLSLASRL